MLFELMASIINTEEETRAGVDLLNVSAAARLDWLVSFSPRL